MPAVHVFGYGAVTSCGAPFQKLPLTFAVGASTVLQPRVMHCYILGLGSCAFARHYLRNHFCFLFLRVMRCFSSPGSPPTRWGTAIANGGLPHSEIRASMGICPYARLIAAYHVLRRLREPRHPSCALLSFPFIDLLAAALGGGGSLRLALNFESRLVCRVCRGLRRGSLCDFVFDLLVFCPTAAYGRFRTSLPSCQCALFPAGRLAGRPCGPRLAPAWWRITDSNR